MNEHRDPDPPDPIDWEVVEATVAARIDRPATVGVAQAFAAVHARIAAADTPVPRSPMAGRRRTGRSWGVVAGLLAAGLVGAVLLVRQRAQTRTPVSYATHTTTQGQVERLTLVDGSRVTLAPNSTLRVAESFGEFRAVQLIGEAYFEVPKAAGVPFVVRTGAVTTRVLGTAFDVRQYANDAHVRVAVVSGKVSAGATLGATLAGRIAPVTLVAGTVGRVTDSTATIEQIHDASDYADWTNGRLVFKQTPVSELLRVVGNWYGLQFHVADSALMADRFTVVLDHKTQPDALRALEQILDVTMTSDETDAGTPVITLHPRQRSAVPRRRDYQQSFSPKMEVGR